MFGEWGNLICQSDTIYKGKTCNVNYVQYIWLQGMIYKITVVNSQCDNTILKSDIVLKKGFKEFLTYKNKF